MKLAKKMLASVLALALVAALALTAFAAAPTLSVVPNDTTVAVGETLTLTVAGVDMVGTETGTLFFQFNPEVLEFVSVESTDDGFAGEGGMKLDSNDTVSYGFMFMSGAKKDTTFATITFKVIAEGDATVNYTVDSWTGTDAPADGSVAINALAERPTEPPVVDEPTTAAPVEDTSKTNTPTNPGTKIPQTGEAGVAAVAGIMALAAVAFVVTRKKDEE